MNVLNYRHVHNAGARCKDCCNDLCKYLPALCHQNSKKGRTLDELLQFLEWLTGFNQEQLHELIEQKVTFKEFFKQANVNPNARLITGSICGYKIQEIRTRLTRKSRYMDKLVDELAKGKKLEKILRTQ